MADFHFKLLHRVLPSEENLFHWKISNSKKSRFGCTGTENYNHLFITCPKLNDTHLLIEQILKLLGIEVKLSLKTLIFGYKTAYSAYTQINRLMTHICYAIFKFWVKNDNSINLQNWIFCELKYWQIVYSHTQAKCEILNNLLTNSVNCADHFIWVLCKAYAVTVILPFRFGKKAERTSMLCASEARPVSVSFWQESSENTRAANIYVCNTLCIFTRRDAIYQPTISEFSYTCIFHTFLIYLPETLSSLKSMTCWLLSMMKLFVIASPYTKGIQIIM